MKQKVFLPKWQRWYVVPLMVIIWGFVTYQEFFSGQPRELGIVGYVILTAILLGVGGLLWLMTAGKLPAYVIEEDETKEE